MTTTNQTAKLGDPFPCPKCGASRWLAFYPETARQSCDVVVAADGGPDIEEWTGCEDDGVYGTCDGSGDADEIMCRECDATVPLFTGPTVVELRDALGACLAWIDEELSETRRTEADAPSLAAARALYAQVRR